MPSFVIPPLTITLVFSRLTFQPLLSKASYHYKNLFLSLLIVSLIRTMSSAYSNSLSTPSGTSDNIYHHCKNKGDSTDPWCIPTLTSNSSDNSESTQTFVFAPSYRLITDLTIMSGTPFFLIAHSKTFLGTLSKAFTRSTKHICNYFPLA